MTNSAEAALQPNGGVRQEAAPAAAGSGPKRTARRRVRGFKAAAKDFALGAALPAAALIAWQSASSAGLISPAFLPSPLAILRSFARLAASEQLLHHLLVSMGRAGLGFLLGAAAGLLLGLATGLFRKAQYLLDPSIQALRLVPHLALAPLIILWFGFGEASKVAIISSGAFFPLYVNTFLGIRNADNKLFEVARVLGFSPGKTVTRLVLPAALPDVLIGIRLSMAVAWIGLVVAELIGSQSGIGFLINEAKQNMETEVIFAGIAVFAMVGKLIDSLMRAVERKYLHWRDGYQG
jgi:sulfonate transport system permease protein